MSGARAFLLLQGVCSPFFARLGDSLKARGHSVHKVNFNVGDCAYWIGRPALNYRGHVTELRGFLEDQYRKLGITDQILFGDRRPIHRPAVDAGKHSAVRTHVFEEGYFRPYWVTLERDGVNGHSRLPRDPRWYRDVGARLPDFGDGRAFRSSFSVRAAHDVAYHAAGFLNPLCFPKYQRHAPVNAAVEYMCYMRRLPLLRLHNMRDAATMERLIQGAARFFFLPLQLSSDAQILDHSRFKDMRAVIAFVLESFAKHAPDDARLVIKNHPLDTGQTDYRKAVRDTAQRFGIKDRVHYLETGDLNVLLKGACGTVTVNSTVGALALAMNCPTIALGAPIYDMSGLTFQGALDDFWRSPEPPDEGLFRCFRNTVIKATQVNGGFYSGEGIGLAVENSCPALESGLSPLEQLVAQ
jgi:capsular polysaccharide export protein